MSTSIREYVDTDYDFLHDGFVAYLAEEKARVGILGIPDDFPETYVPRLIQKVRSEHGTILVAEVDGRPAGYVAMLPKDPQPWDQTRSRTAMLMELFVAPEHRRRGVARRLFDEIEARSAAQGFEWITLGVMGANDVAQSFYAAQGYRPTYHFMGKPLRARSVR